MQFDKVKSVYFLGIGGIGMSALAKYYMGQGVSVSGYDLTPSEITDELIQSGAEIHFEENIDKLPSSIDLVIYTPAVPKKHKELLFFMQHNTPLFKRSEVLGLIAKNYKTIAIAGTHGKTTTTSICSHLFNSCGEKINAFIGGIALNSNSNYVFNKSATICIVEADEFDRSFLTLNPAVAIITSIEADHLDIYGSAEELKLSFYKFAQQIKPEGYLIHHKNIQIPVLEGVNCLTYHIDDTSADVFASNIHIQEGYYVFDLNFKKRIIQNIRFGIPGIHNLENALAAIAALLVTKNVDSIKLSEALSSFKGVHRRFETVFFNQKIRLIDDYAHHPTEISTCLNSLKALYPDKKITAVFQPHLYSRTRDFAENFAKSLAIADKLILLNIYPAREEPIPNITSEWLLSLVSIKDKVLSENTDLIKILDQSEHEIIVMMGAGNIDRMIDVVKDYLTNKYQS